MDGIIDKDSNPFIKDSWIEQGYSFTPDRQELAPRLFKRSIEEIKSFKEENYYSYPAFLAIRWGFAFLRNNILFPSYKWNHREYYDGFGKPQTGYNYDKVTKTKGSPALQAISLLFHVLPGILLQRP